MDRYTMIVAVMGQVCGTALLITLITSWFGRRKQSAGQADGAAQRVERRLAEMQQSIDAVAVEVERISEGQRFTTKLLAERGAIPAGEMDGVGEPARRNAVR